MALDKTKLTSDIQTAFESAKEQAWLPSKIAQELAKAIDTYVTAAEVGGIKIGTDAKQVGTVKLR